MPIPAGLALGIGAGSSLAGGLLSSGPERPDNMYSAIGMPAQANMLQSMVNSYASGSGEFGFGPAAQSGMSTLLQAMRDRGFTGNMSGGVGGSLVGNMLAQAMGQDISARRGYGLSLAQAQPWTMNYQHRGASPMGPSGYRGVTDGNRLPRMNFGDIYPV